MAEVDKHHIRSLISRQEHILDNLFKDIKKKLNPNNTILEGFKKMKQNIKEINEELSASDNSSSSHDIYY